MSWSNFTAHVVAGVIAMMALVASASAESPTWEGGLSWLVRNHHSASVDAVTNSNTELFGNVVLARHVPAFDVASIIVSLGVELEGGRLSGTTFQSMNAEVTQRSYSVLVRGRRPLRKWVNAMASLSLGYATGHLDLEALPSASTTLSDDAAGVSFAWLAGCEFPVRFRQQAELSLQASVGHRSISSMSFAAKNRESDDSLAITTLATDLGDINLSSWTFQMGLALRY